MIIRKLFKVENAHIVRGCSTLRCSENIHGHSYTIEVLLESNYLDNGQMVYDFSLMKRQIKELVDAFDHSITLWSEDEQSYKDDMKKHSKRWIEMPVSPSAEQFARVIFLMAERVLECTGMVNGEREVKVHSIIAHETQTGYAQAFREDAHSKLMGTIQLEDVTFSKSTQEEWNDKELWSKLLNHTIMTNPKQI